jgi:hypothetical protein
MASTTQICNLALAKLGANLITSLEQTNSKEATLCSLLFERVRDAVLEEFPWPFATKRNSLAQLSETPAFGYDLYYQVPSDCLHILELFPEGRFLIEGNKIATNVVDAQARYIFRETNPNRYSASFILALAFRLAAELAEPISGSTSKSQEMWQLYQRQIAEAKLTNANKGRWPQAKPDPWLSVAGIDQSSTSDDPNQYLPWLRPGYGE